MACPVAVFSSSECVDTSGVISRELFGVGQFLT